jgi:hypothetical protein
VAPALDNVQNLAAGVVVPVIASAVFETNDGHIQAMGLIDLVQWKDPNRSGEVWRHLWTGLRQLV